MCFAHLHATTSCTFSTSQLPKVLRAWCALYILTWKCASRRNGVHFFDISTSKSAPSMVCFVHFDFELCFAPQRCALFRHLNLLRAWCALNILTWKCASHHNFAHFFDISTSKSAPSMVCLVHFVTWKCASRHNGVHFRDLNVQKCPEHEVPCTFWLGSVLRATTACTFSTW